MGSIADRTIEHLGVSDTAVIQIRRLLLQTLDKHAVGEKLPGTDPAGHQVRSSRFTAPRERTFSETMERYVRLEAPVTAE